MSSNPQDIKGHIAVTGIVSDYSYSSREQTPNVRLIAKGGSPAWEGRRTRAVVRELQGTRRVRLGTGFLEI